MNFVKLSVNLNDGRLTWCSEWQTATAEGQVHGMLIGHCTESVNLAEEWGRQPKVTSAISLIRNFGVCTSQCLVTTSLPASEMTATETWSWIIYWILECDLITNRTNASYADFWVIKFLQ